MEKETNRHVASNWQTLDISMTEIYCFYGNIFIIIPYCCIEYISPITSRCRGRHGRDRMVVGFTISYATNVVSSNPTQERCVRYNIMW